MLITNQQVLAILADGEDISLQNQLYTAKHLVTKLAGMGGRLPDTLDMLEEAIIQLSEVSDELCHYCDRLNLGPNRPFELEQCISKQTSLARKRHTVPEVLPQLYQSLLGRQQQSDDQADSLETLILAVNNHHQQALETTKTLHKQRQHYVQELGQLITESMYALPMSHGVSCTDVKLERYHLSVSDADHIEFKVTTSPGQPLQPIVRMASGGELSRIALAIQAITARKMETPALIFDEVDVGINDPTAAVVGKILHQLGESTQVTCATHLLQVVGCGHQHFYINGKMGGTMTETYTQPLDKRARLQELARLSGGSEVTRNTLANARGLLAA